jgi:hypothetical protein
LVDTFSVEISPLISIHWSEISPFLCKIVIIFDILHE